MSLIRKIFHYLIHNPRKLLYLSFNYLLKTLSPILSDKAYIKLKYRLVLGSWPNLKEPKTFNEKLQWLKLYNRNPEYTIMADKVKAKEWVASRIGKEHIIPNLGVWNCLEDIDFDSLPNQFVLKLNHNSGTGMYICRDKSLMDITAVKKELKKGLRENYYLHHREWPYKDIPRRILAEKYMQDEECPDLTDYKFFCFNGKPFMMYISKDNASNTTTDFFDMNYNLLPIRMKDPNSKIIPDKPKEFEEMKRLATILCKGLPHIRVDFYVINHQIYFGEMTFFHNAGFQPVYPEKWNEKLGDMISIKYNN